MKVKELKEIIDQVDEELEVSVYDVTSGERYYVDEVDTTVRGHFEFNIGYNE